jgi:hypothetical protein
MSPGPVHRTSGARSQPSAADLAAVVVELPAAGGRRRSLGTAAQALRTAGLTAPERAAILALVEAVRLLRERVGYAGIDDAGMAVRLLLRDPDATTRGPWATTGAVAVGSRNALAERSGGRARPDVLLTVDAAVHELAHVIQFQRMDSSAKPNPALLEGIADAAAILATDDDTLGEEFYRVDASGRHRGSIRELGPRRTSGPPVGPVVTDYRQVAGGSVEEHAAGGVVSAAFRSIRAQLGRERAEALLWAVVRDSPSWSSGGSWSSLVASMRAQAQRIWSGDPTALAALERALRATGLDTVAAAA